MPRSLSTRIHESLDRLEALAGSVTPLHVDAEVAHRLRASSVGGSRSPLPGLASLHPQSLQNPPHRPDRRIAVTVLEPGERLRAHLGAPSDFRLREPSLATPAAEVSADGPADDRVFDGNVLVVIEPLSVTDPYNNDLIRFDSKLHAVVTGSYPVLSGERARKGFRTSRMPPR